MSNFLPLQIRNILERTGWTDNETLVYSALLEKGSMDLTTISHETSIAISSLQYVLKKLISKKMIRKSLRNGKPLYAAANPEMLRKWTKGYVKQFLHFEETMQNFIDQYDFSPQVFTSKVRFYEGQKGIKKSYRQMVKECSSGEIVSVYSMTDLEHEALGTFYRDEYIPARLEKGITMRVIAVDTETAREFQTKDKEHGRQTLLVPAELLPTHGCEINVYNDCVHSVSKGATEPYGMIIHDKNLAAMQRALFESMWTVHQP